GPDYPSRAKSERVRASVPEQASRWPGPATTGEWYWLLRYRRNRPRQQQKQTPRAGSSSSWTPSSYQAVLVLAVARPTSPDYRKGSVAGVCKLKCPYPARNNVCANVSTMTGCIRVNPYLGLSPGQMSQSPQ